MFGLIMVLLTLTGVVLAVIGIVAVFDVALGSGRDIVAAREADARRWVPPFIAGRDLFQWARGVTGRIVRDVMVSNPKDRAATEIVERLHEGTTRAMLPGIPEVTASRSVACPPEGQGLIGVTPPEAIALADHLRATAGSGELNTLRDEAKQCVEWIETGLLPSPCALQGDDCHCRAFAARPLECRPLLATRLAELQGGAFGQGEGPTFLADHTDAVARGVTAGLEQGLDSAGLDGGRYELHSALLVALDHPDAAVRWAEGEDLFTECRPAARGVLRRRAEP